MTSSGLKFIITCFCLIYFDPANVYFFDNINKYFLGKPNRYFGQKNFTDDKRCILQQDPGVRAFTASGVRDEVHRAHEVVLVPGT